MTFWIFKKSQLGQYPDERGRTYIYDNRHSVRVAVGDSVVYLDKRLGGYGFTGHGTVMQVHMKASRGTDQPKINRIYTSETGVVSIAEGSDLDSAAPVHVSSLSAEARLKLLNGIDTEFLRQRQSEED